MPATVQHGLHCIRHFKLQCWHTHSSHMLAEPLRCFNSTCSWLSWRLHLKPCIWLNMPATVRDGLHCIRYFKLQCWHTHSSHMLAEPLRCFSCTCKRTPRRLHLESCVGVYMPAPVQHRLYCVRHDKLQCWNTHRSHMLPNCQQ